MSYKNWVRQRKKEAHIYETGVGRFLDWDREYMKNNAGARNKNKFYNI